jgi:hypothetical protein
MKPDRMITGSINPIRNHHRSLLRIRNSWDQYSQWKSRYNKKYAFESE